MNVTELQAYRPNTIKEAAEVQLEVRFMLSDRREGRCPLAELTTDEAVISTPTRAEVGSPIICYVQGFGRFEGIVDGFSAAGLHVKLNASDHQRQRIHDRLSGVEQRRASRVQLSENHSLLVLEGGTEIRCMVRDISLTGAAVETDMRPAIGTTVSIGRTRGRVVRHFEGGIGIDFLPD